MGPRWVAVVHTTTTHLRATTGGPRTVIERCSTSKPIPTVPRARRTSWSGHAGTPQQRGLAAARADSLPSRSSHTFHSPWPPGTHQSASRFFVRRFTYRVNAGARAVRNSSVHLISESNATPRTASSQRYPPKPPNSPLNKLRIASITPMNGANNSAIPPKLPNKSPKIITLLLSLLFRLLVPCRFSLPYCGRRTDSGCSRGSPLGHIVWCFRETEQPVSESQIRRSQDRHCVTSRCKKQLAHTKVIQAVAISPAPSSNLSGAPGCHRSRILCLQFLVH